MTTPTPDAFHDHWPPRLSKSLRPPRTTLWDNLVTSARRYPDKTAIRFFDRALSYRELLRQCETLAAWLSGAGVRPGDRVLVMMQNCPQLVIAHYAIMRANAVVVPINPMNKASELGHYIRNAGAKAAICSAELARELTGSSFPEIGLRFGGKDHSTVINAPAARASSSSCRNSSSAEAVCSRR